MGPLWNPPELLVNEAPRPDPGARGTMGVQGIGADMNSVGFDELERLLATSGAEVAASEAHGCLAGALCATAPYTLGQWLEEIIPDDEAARLADDARRAFAAVFAETFAALAGGEMDFQPLLPDDDVALERRVAGLAQWCHGFLYGLGMGSTVALERLPGELGEILRDFDEITRAAVDEEDGEEAGEAAWAELVEFVRTGAQIVFEELAGARQTAMPADNRMH